MPRPHHHREDLGEMLSMSRHECVPRIADSRDHQFGQLGVLPCDGWCPCLAP